MVDWFHWSLKAAMHASCSGSDWVDQLPWVPLGLRAGPREEDALSPTQAVFGTPLILTFSAKLKSHLVLFLKKSGSEACRKLFP